VRFSYRILNKQLENYHLKAIRQMRALRKQGKESDYGLFMSLESRLDVVVYRMGFATTLASARQLVVHSGRKGKVFVNNKLQTIPSFPVKPGALVEVRVNIEKQKDIIRAALSLATEPPSWLSVQVDQTEGLFKGTFIRPPNRDELPADLRDSESRIIQIYSE
jgi:small subunit ribosomal protein S4